MRLLRQDWYIFPLNSDGAEQFEKSFVLANMTVKAMQKSVQKHCPLYGANIYRDFSVKDAEYHLFEAWMYDSARVFAAMPIRCQATARQIGDFTNAVRKGTHFLCFHAGCQTHMQEAH